MSELMIHVSDESFQKDVLESDLPVILDFWAPWCGPCKAIAPMLDRLAKQHEGVVRFAKYDVDQSAQSRERYGVRGVPTLVAYRNGKEVLRTTGVSPSSMQSILNAALFEAPKPDAAALSFKSDAQLKQKAVAALQVADYRLPDDNGEPAYRMPTAVLTDRLGGDYSDVLGLPSFVGILQDGLFEMAMDRGGDATIAVRWLDAIPVGQPMQPVLALLVGVALHDGEHGLFPQLTQVVALPALTSFLSDLTRLQVQGGDEQAWSALQARLEPLGAELKTTSHAYLARFLRDLAKPLDRYSALDLMDVLPMSISLGLDALQEPYLPEDEKALEVLQERLSAIDAAKPAADLDEAGQKAWAQQQAAQGEAVLQAFWQEHPLVEQHVRERDERLQLAYQKQTQATQDLLLATLRSLGRA
jgi:thioredoxin 1